MTIYDDFAASVKKLLTTFGFNVVLIRENITSTDPVEGTIEQGAPDELTTVAVFKSMTEKIKAEFKGALDSDSKMISSPDVEPKMNDTFIRDGATWRIVEVVTNKPTDVVVSYSSLVRK